MKDFSNEVGLSPHTLRYYEKIGLLNGVQRNISGHRCYTKNDAAWINFVKRLKETGMPLNEILEYAALKDGGQETVKDRENILTQHKESLIKHMRLLEKHLEALDYKIDLYKRGKVC